MTGTYLAAWSIGRDGAGGENGRRTNTIHAARTIYDVRRATGSERRVARITTITINAR